MAVPLHEPRLLADAMLGGLARWLRVLGLDVVYDPGLDDAALVELAVAEERTLLTRDRQLVRRRRARRYLLIESEVLPEQVGQVLRALELQPRQEALFSRCLRCNTPLEKVPPEVARPLVPPYVARTQERFRACPACRRVYWRATHSECMRQRLEEWGLWPQG